MANNYDWGIIQGGTGSFGSIQYTDGTEDNRIEILDKDKNLKNIQTLQASSSVQFDTTLNVDGAATLGNTLNVSGQSTLASAAVSDLTDGRIVLAGTSGELEDSAKLTFDGSKLSVDGIVSGSGQLQGASVAVNGDVSAANGSFSGGLTVTGDATVTGDVSAESGSFSGDMTITGDLTVNGTTTTVNSTEVTIADKALVVANGSNDGDIGTAGGAGLKVGSENSSLASFLYDGSNSWDSSENMNLASGKSFNIANNDMLNISGAAKVRSDVAGDGLGHSAGILSVNVDDSSIETNDDTLRIKAGGVTNAMLSGGIASTKIAELNNFDTDNLAEGSNLYYTDARARAAVSANDVSGDGSFSYNSSTGVFTYTGPSASEVRAHLSVNDVSGDGSLSYDSGSGVITYTGPSAAEVRAHLSGTDNGGDGSFSYNQSTGEISYTGPSASETRAHFSAADFITLTDGEISVNATDFSASWDDALATKDTGDLAEGSNLYYTDARARAAVSVTDAGGDGSLAYNSSTGVITYTGPSASEVRAHLSVTDAGGDGSLSYDSGSGVITYTGPSAAEVRAHISGAANITITDGDIALDTALTNMTSMSASSFVSASSFEVDGQASISYDTSALDFSTDGAGAKLSTTMFSASVELQGPSMEVSGAAKAGSLYLGASGSTVSVILDEDDMGSDSDTALATQQSIKAYVDAQLTAQSLAFTDDSSTGGLSIDLDSETLEIIGTSNEIETLGSGNQIKIGLPDDVTISNNLTVSGAVTLGDTTGDDITFNGSLASNLAVKVDDAYTIGAPTKKLAAVYANNVYTGDFHMKNERGDWTLFEESDHIRIRNNATGQEFKLDMTPLV